MTGWCVMLRGLGMALQCGNTVSSGHSDPCYKHKQDVQSDVNQNKQIESSKICNSLWAIGLKNFFRIHYWKIIKYCIIVFHQAQTLLIKHCFFTTGTVECWMPSWSCDRQGWFTLSTDRFDPTVWPNSRDNLTVAIENYLWSSDQRLTCQTTAVHLRLLFSSDASSPTDRFFIRFSTQSSNQSGNGTPALISHTQWVTGTSDHHVSVVVSFF